MRTRKLFLWASLLVVPLTAACSPEQAIRMAFAPHGEHVQEQAVRVAWCESRHQPHAVNGVHRGLFQMNVRLHQWRVTAWGITPYDGVLFNAWENALAARHLYEESGNTWRHWSCRP